MKKVFFIIVLLFSFSWGFAQPGGEDFCECCEEMIDEDTGLPYIGQESEYAICSSKCDAYYNSGGPNPCGSIPIDSNIILLLILGIGVGSYKIYTIRKRAIN